MSVFSCEFLFQAQDGAKALRRTQPAFQPKAAGHGHQTVEQQGQHSLLPIVRNTYEGLKNVQGSLKEAAVGIGMTPRQVLFRVELPNAVPIIIGGVRVRCG
jgi:hypothetical protein